MTKIGLVDDHRLLRDALASTINNFGNCQVIVHANHGKELMTNLSKDNPPDIILLDLNMPIMDGFQTAAWLKEAYPDVRVLVLSMFDSELSMIRLLKLGVRGFLKKDIHPGDLRHAIEATMQTGYYYDGSKLVHFLKNLDPAPPLTSTTMLTDVEMSFLKLACSEMTYKQIALQMKVSPRTVDGYRESLFNKLNVKTRVGIVLFAINNGLTQAGY